MENKFVYSLPVEMQDDVAKAAYRNSMDQSFEVLNSHIFIDKMKKSDLTLQEKLRESV